VLRLLLLQVLVVLPLLFLLLHFGRQGLYLRLHLCLLLLLLLPLLLLLLLLG
jgi:hypothetical protein